jgi:hypothetical protein
LSFLTSQRQEIESEIRQPLLEVRENLASYLATADKKPQGGRTNSL